VATLFYSKARIKLNPKKLYTADGYAVQELLKVAQLLYNAYTVKGDEQEESRDFVLPTRLSNLKGTKGTAQEIIDTGAKLHDLMGKEGELRDSREQALKFLENIESLQSDNEQVFIEKKVKDIIQQQSENIREMQNVVKNLEKDEKVLEENIKRMTQALEREEKKYQTVKNVKPAYMDEYERLEQELERYYNIYLEKFRNIDYLENQMDIYHQVEEEKFQDNQKHLKRMQERIKAEEWRQLRGDEEIDEGLLEQQILRDENLNSRAQSRGKQAPGFGERGGRNPNRYREKLDGPNEEEEDDMDEDEDDQGDDDRDNGNEDDDDFGDVQRDSESDF
jgi:clusterin-associated protein 1